MGAFGKPAENEEDLFTFEGLDEVDTSPFYVPPGTYEVQCTDVEKSISKANNPMTVFTMSILKPVGDGASKDGVGKDLKIFAAMTPQAMWKLVETLTALGLPCDKKKVQFKRDDIVSKKCLASVKDGTYDGEKTSNIKKCTPLSKGK